MSAKPLYALALLSLVAMPVFAQNDKVVARVNGVEVRQSDIDAAEEDVGGANLKQLSPEQKKEYLLGYAIDLTIATKAAEGRKLADNPDFKKKLAYFRQKLLVETLLAEETKAKVTDAEKKKLYDDEIGKVKPEDEVRARHILVESEAEIKDIAAKLKAGGDFAALAKEKSKDPGSAAEGGDLGFFSNGQMVPEFSEAAFKLKAGEISEPVKTQFGWHILKVEERRTKAVPTFEQVKGQLEDFLTRKVQAELIQNLRKDAKIEKLDDTKK